MKQKPPASNLLIIAPKPHVFVARVRQLAETTDRIKFTQHARERMMERDIPIRVAVTVIREGTLTGDIEPGANAGEWKAKIVRNIKGRRDVGVVVLLVRNDVLVVKTVEWEDLR